MPLPPWNLDRSPEFMPAAIANPSMKNSALPGERCVVGQERFVTALRALWRLISTDFGLGSEHHVMRDHDDPPLLCPPLIRSSNVLHKI